MPTSKSYRTKFTIMMDPELSKELRKIALDENSSASDIIEELTEKYIREHKKNLSNNE